MIVFAVFLMGIHSLNFGTLSCVNDMEVVGSFSLSYEHNVMATSLIRLTGRARQRKGGGEPESARNTLQKTEAG